MKPFFSSVQAARWPYADHRLHVYLLPDAAVADLAAAYQQGLDHAGIAGLSRIPAEWLHLTVQLLTVPTDDLTFDQMTRLVDELRVALATVSPVRPDGRAGAGVGNRGDPRRRPRPALAGATRRRPPCDDDCARPDRPTSTAITRPSWMATHQHRLRP